MGGPKMEYVILLFNDARPGRGNVITHPHVGVAGGHGSNARGRCERAGELSTILRFYHGKALLGG